MSTRRRTRKAASVHPPATVGVTAAAPAAQARPPLPQYRWRQFPVYFALALGLFIGLELGLIAGWSDSTLLTTIFSSVIAVFLGFGIARLVVVWMMNHNWVRPRPKRKR